MKISPPYGMVLLTASSIGPYRNRFCIHHKGFQSPQKAEDQNAKKKKRLPQHGRESTNTICHFPLCYAGEQGEKKVRIPCRERCRTRTRLAERRLVGSCKPLSCFQRFFLTSCLFFRASTSARSSSSRTSIRLIRLIYFYYFLLRSHCMPN